MRFLEWINLYGLGVLFPIYLCVIGSSVSVALRHFVLLHPFQSIRLLFSEKKHGTYSPLRAMSLALAGTLGVGNIVGVAVALSLGGSGALFWMWMSAFATMLIKYAEITLSVAYRREKKANGITLHYGGPMYYIERKWGRTAGKMFAVLCICASFCGNLVQMRSASEATTEIFHLPRWLGAVLIFVGCTVLIHGGRDRIASFTSCVIPCLTVLYVLFCCYAIISMRARMPAVLASVFRSAFSPRSAAGGFSGHLVLCAMRHGIAKGVYSHEAGCGTAPISYAGADSNSPAQNGMFGILEVFVDTILLCTLTGLVILGAFPDACFMGGEGLCIVTQAFSKAIGGFSVYFLAGSIIVFAFSTVICWSFYGSESVGYLTKRSAWIRRYRFAFCLISSFSVFLGSGFVWELNDFFTVCMTILNTACLLTYLPQLQKITRCALRGQSWGQFSERK